MNTNSNINMNSNSDTKYKCLFLDGRLDNLVRKKYVRMFDDEEYEASLQLNRKVLLVAENLNLVN